MKNQKSVIVAALILVFIAGYQLWSKRQKEAPSVEAVSLNEVTPKASARSNPKQATVGSAKTAAGAVNAAKSESTSPAVQGAPSTAQERASLKTMSQILAQSIRPGAKQSDLIRALQKMKAEPFVARDKNDYTGSMDIIRTKNPLPGTRYFHAQYFGDGKKENFVQHMSFEFKPGPNAVAEAVAAAQAAFNVGAPDEKRAGFSQWELADGYCVWISPLGKNDLKNNPFNAYTEQDIGSVRMAVELCPHDHQ